MRDMFNNQHGDSVRTTATSKAEGRLKEMAGRLRGRKDRLGKKMDHVKERVSEAKSRVEGARTKAKSAVEGARSRISGLSSGSSLGGSAGGKTPKMMGNLKKDRGHYGSVASGAVKGIMEKAKKRFKASL